MSGVSGCPILLYYTRDKYDYNAQIWDQSGTLCMLWQEAQETRTSCLLTVSQLAPWGCFCLCHHSFFPSHVFTRRHGNQLTSWPTVMHTHRGACRDTLSALKVIWEEYVIIPLENCVKTWQSNFKPSCKMAEWPRNAFKVLIKQISHVTQMQLIPFSDVQPDVVYCHCSSIYLELVKRQTRHHAE